jgi:release factor glutamine methyltransferase
LELEAKVSFHQGDLLDAPFNSENFDIICANLPYVPTADLSSLPPDIADYEPRKALDGGQDGLELYLRLLPQAQKALKPGGMLLLEIHPPQCQTLKKLSESLGLIPLEPLRDFSRKERIFLARAPEAQN